MFDTLVVQPVFNLLEFIYAIVPGHDLGVAIILFTLVIRLALWPLVRKQLHHARAMRKLAPELKKLKKAAGGDRQKEARLQMELYKEHEIKPFATIGTLIIQIPIFIALYSAVNKIIKDPSSLVNFSYDWVRDLPWIRHIGQELSRFDETLLGILDLTRNGIGDSGIYLPAIILATITAIVQIYQSKLMIRDQKDARKLSVIMREAAEGKQSDQAEVTAAVSRAMLYFLPAITFIFAITLPSALSLYILVSSAVGYVQQWAVLKQDQAEMLAIADEPDDKEQKTTSKEQKAKPKKSKSKKSSSKKKRRK